MSFDPIIANPGRLRILAALAGEPVQEFVRLRGLTSLTDGNLAAHARRLRNAGMIQMHKSIRDGKPVTHFQLTPDGIRALTEHAHHVMQAVNATAGPAADRQIPLEPTVAAPVLTTVDEEEPWVD